MAKKFTGRKKYFNDELPFDNLLMSASDHFRKNPMAVISAKQLARKIGLSGKKRVAKLQDALLALENKRELIQVEPGVFKAAKVNFETIVGVVDNTNPRFAFIISEDSANDIMVKSRDLNFAFHGDIVRVAVYPKKHGSNPEGEVLEVIERKRAQFVGRIEINKNFAFVIPDGKKMHVDIFIPSGKIGKATHGDKVLVDVIKWPSSTEKNPVGEIVEVLGKAGEHDVEMHAILAEFGLPSKFPQKIEEIALNIPENISEEEIKRRRDFRDVVTFTIDPIDAKDFDDAISVETLDNGNVEIGVHIADVTHYVKENSVLDKEAYTRATSVYLVDRVVPMLPERLSNELCSLRPNEDKLTFSAVFEIDENADVIKSWFGRTIIHSDQRFAYEDAQEIIEGKESEFSKEILLLNELALKLRERRFKKGAIGFETQEVRFQLDETGKPIAVIPKVRKEAHKLIEDFMLLANKYVAEYVFTQKEGKEKQPKTMVYRTHDNPNPEKLLAFANFARRFGHEVNIEEEGAVSRSLNKLVQAIEGKPEENILQSLAIRSMAKAKYTIEAQGHFGLAFKHYTHFTSPIRRYPDMMVHRLLARYLDGEKSAEEKEYEDKCQHSSDMEKNAADAERASIKYKQVEYMSYMKDRTFEGVVSGVTEWGLFIEIIETKCEGMVRLADLDDDHYDYDPDNLRVIGRNNKRMITFGDKMHVRVKHTDLMSRTIDLAVVKDEEEAKKKDK